MSTASPPARVLLVGRSAAERSVVAAAFRRAAHEVLELSRASELDLVTLRSASIVVALDQHDFVQRCLDDAQEYGFYPLFLPVRYAQDDAHYEASKTVQPMTAKPRASAVEPLPASVASVVQAETQPEMTLQQQIDALLQRVALLQEGAPLPAHTSDAAPLFLTRAEQEALDPFHDKPLPAWTEASADESAVRVQSVFELKPEWDPKNSDPGPLPELQSGSTSPFLVMGLGLVLALAAAFLILAPEPPLTPEEEAAIFAEMARTTESQALRSAEHLVYRARRIAMDRQAHQRSIPVICQRLLDEGRTELAQSICAQAHANNPAQAGPYAQALIARDVLEHAEVVLRIRLDEAPDDRRAWQALAELARRKGQDDVERQAIEELLRIDALVDPTAALRERLKELSP